MKENLIEKRLDWSQYPLGTKAYAISGGHWVKVENGWKWHCGDVFPRPGGDFGGFVSLPEGSPEADIRSSGSSLNKEKAMADVINDLTLVVEMYVDDYPFDEDHKAKHRQLVDYACSLIGKPRNMDELKKMVGHDDRQKEL